jgi:hypothetical protein
MCNGQPMPGTLGERSIHRSQMLIAKTLCGSSSCGQQEPEIFHLRCSILSRTAQDQCARMALRFRHEWVHPVANVTGRRYGSRTHQSCGTDLFRSQRRQIVCSRLTPPLACPVGNSIHRSSGSGCTPRASPFAGWLPGATRLRRPMLCAWSASISRQSMHGYLRLTQCAAGRVRVSATVA